MVEYIPVIIGAFVGFCALAAILLIPVYRFLKREERLGEAFTREVLGPDAQPNRPAPDDPAQ